MDTITPAFTADCGHEIPPLPAGHVGGTGYGVEDIAGKEYKRCYQCCAGIERQFMVDTGKTTLYLSRTVDNQWMIGDWAGALKFPAFNITKSYGRGFGGARYDIVTGRFLGPNDKLWAFRNAGDNQIARCIRLKDPR